ncbi:MAG: hypothetical protein AAGD07_00435 [Planctomycetota bacterium]
MLHDPEHDGRSWVARRAFRLAFIVSACVLVLGAPGAIAQSPAVPGANASLLKDPSYGTVYRKVTQTVERPIAERTMVQRQETVYTPRTVTESKPQTRRTYMPVVRYHWKPRVEGWWNPFRQPTVAYHHVPETTWEARDEIVHQTYTHVKWVAENRTVQVPETRTRIVREQHVALEPVGQVAQAAPATTTRSSIPPALAARLRPLAANERVAPLASSRVAMSAPIGGQSLASVPPSLSVAAVPTPVPARTSLQSGMRATDLTPTTAGAYGSPVTSPIVAGLPTMPLWR